MKRLQKLLHHNLPLDSKQSDGELNPLVVFQSRSFGVKSCSLPLCGSCALSNLKKHKIDSQLKSNGPKKEMAFQRNHLNPGECFSLDQYVVPHQG